MWGSVCVVIYFDFDENDRSSELSKKNLRHGELQELVSVEGENSDLFADAITADRQYDNRTYDQTKSSQHRGE